MKTSASRTRRWSTSRPFSVRKSSARLRLLRASKKKPGLSGRSGFGTARLRYGSPIPGGSILTTSAPKSDITVAAAGPAIKLAQSITFKPSKTRSLTTHLQEFSRNQAEGVAIALDPPCGPSGEMGADDEHGDTGEAGQHALAGQARLGRVAVCRRRPVRASDLAGVVNESAGDQGLFAPRRDRYADMAGRVAQGRHETDFVADPVVSLDEVDQRLLPDRGHRVGEHGRHVFALIAARPVGELGAAHQIAGIREG